MMDGWRRKMDTGHTINIDDLRRGIGLVSPEHLKTRTERDESADQSFSNEDISEIRLPSDEVESSALLEAPKPDLVTAEGSSPKRKRDVLEPPEFFDLRPSSRKQASADVEAEDMEAELGAAGFESGEEDNLPRMTVAEKLEMARTEAEEAAASRATKSKNRMSKLPVSTNGQHKGPVSALSMDGAADSEQDDTVGKLMPTPIAKKTKIKGRPRRRKSTLSPEELEALLVENEES